MSRFANLHLLAPLAIVVGALALPFLGTDAPRYSASDTSAVRVVAKAASAGVPPAQAFPLDGAAIATARTVATTYWNVNPCGGNVALNWVPMEAGTNATASWRNPTDAWNNAGQNFDCKIDINTGAEYDFAKLCTVLTHEIGHLAGQQHVEQPGQLMSAYYTDPLPQCVSAAPAAGAPAPEPAALEPLAAAPQAKKSPLRSTSAQTKSTKTAKKAKKAAKRRCVVRFKAGKRTKRCVTVKTVKRGAKAARARA